MDLVDVWTAPPIPVVCVIGSGKPTATHFGYCESWPHVFGEEPQVLKYEDGDITVSATGAWREMRGPREVRGLPTADQNALSYDVSGDG